MSRSADFSEADDAPVLRAKLRQRMYRTEDCWIWKYALPPGNSPRLRVDGRELPARHLAWRIGYGEWPTITASVRVVPMCGNRQCVRPRHLGLLGRSEILRLRSLRLELGEERTCRRCQRVFWVKRWRLVHRPNRYCSARCLRGPTLFLRGSVGTSSWRGIKGQSVIEYGVMIATISVVVLLGVRLFGDLLQQWLGILLGRVVTLT